jgi:hypothetical protein
MPIIRPTPKRSAESTTTKNRLANKTIRMTSPVVISVSRRVGQVTLSPSARTSYRNWNGLIIRLPGCAGAREMNLNDARRKTIAARDLPVTRHEFGQL